MYVYLCHRQHTIKRISAVLHKKQQVIYLRGAVENLKRSTNQPEASFQLFNVGTCCHILMLHTHNHMSCGISCRLDTIDVQIQIPHNHMSCSISYPSSHNSWLHCFDAQHAQPPMSDILIFISPIMQSIFSRIV